MAETVDLTLDQAETLCMEVLSGNGFAEDHARAITKVICACQVDDCHSHGLYRLIVCVRSIQSGLLKGDAYVEIERAGPSIVRATANGGYSLLAFDRALPILIEAARGSGMAALAINQCFHFSALWPEVERIAAQGLVGLAMLPSHPWVAPFGGTKGIMGTNPIAFSWPRPNTHPFTFDFATSEMARGDIELAARAGQFLPDGAAIDANGDPTNDPHEALKGAMLTFGGHKGSALSLMIELMGGALIGDLVSLDSGDFDGGKGATPYHGELVLAFDPEAFGGDLTSVSSKRAERMFASIEAQGARLPSQRRYKARDANTARGQVSIPEALYRDLLGLA